MLVFRFFHQRHFLIQESVGIQIFSLTSFFLLRKVLVFRFFHRHHFFIQEKVGIQIFSSTSFFYSGKCWYSDFFIDVIFLFRKVLVFRFFHRPHFFIQESVGIQIFSSTSFFYSGKCWYSDFFIDVIFSFRKVLDRQSCDNILIYISDCQLISDNRRISCLIVLTCSCVHIIDAHEEQLLCTLPVTDINCMYDFPSKVFSVIMSADENLLNTVSNNSTNSNDLSASTFPLLVMIGW